MICGVVKLAKAQDLRGIKFGRLLPVYRVDSPNKNHGARWHCVCDCGNEVDVQAGNLKSGHVKSCGCLLTYTNKRTSTEIERDYKTRLYKIWSCMRQRCNNPHSDSYMYYGGRGITVTEAWDSFSEFKAWATKNGYADGLSIDRIDPNGNYTPENCRFVTPKQQARNRRNNVLINVGGHRLCVSECAEMLGMPEETLRSRLRNGWSEERLFTNVRPRRNKEAK